MSLVGPRPCLPYEVEQFARSTSSASSSPPVITGLWQVTARGHSRFGDALDMDVRLRPQLVAQSRPLAHRSDAVPHCTGTRDGHAGSEAGGTTAIEPVRMAVVGLGYWGPNLAAQPPRLPDAELSAVCDSGRMRSSGFVAATLRPATTALDEACSTTRRSRRSPSRRPSRRIDLTLSRHSRPASTSSSRNRSLRRAKQAVELIRARRPSRPRSDAGAHVPLQPARERDPRHLSRSVSWARSTSSRRAG